MFIASLAWHLLNLDWHLLGIRIRNTVNYSTQLKILNKVCPYYDEVIVYILYLIFCRMRLILKTQVSSPFLLIFDFFLFFYHSINILCMTWIHIYMCISFYIVHPVSDKENKKNEILHVTHNIQLYCGQRSFKIFCIYASNLWYLLMHVIFLLIILCLISPRQGKKCYEMNNHYLDYFSF